MGVGGILTISTINTLDVMELSGRRNRDVTEWTMFAFSPGATATPATLWPGSNIAGIQRYIASMSADIDTLSSSSTSDVAPGAIIEVIGNNSDGIQVIQYVLLSGQNKVHLQYPLRAVNRIRNLGTTDTVGTIYCYVDSDITGGVPNTKTTIRAIILPGISQSEQFIFTIPQDSYGLVFGGHVTLFTILPQKTAEVRWIGKVPGRAGLIVGRIPLSSTDRVWNEIYPIPQYIPPGTQIELIIDSVDSATTQLIARLHFYVRKI